MSDPVAAPTSAAAKPPRRWIGIALAVSITLNLVVAGGLVGQPSGRLTAAAA